MAHENLSREQHVEGSSDRAFGLVFAVVFVLIGFWPLFDGRPPRSWAVGMAALFALIAWLKPSLLARLNRLWIRLGVLLSNVVGPIAIGILFYCVVTPLSFMMRLTGKDPLRRKLDPDADSYWIPRKPPGPPPDSMTKQF